MNYTEISNPEDWVDQYGDALFRFALLRVQDTDVAADLVQETFLAGLQARDRFKGESTEKSWLVGILKHKIQDHYRAKSREILHDDIQWPEHAADDDGAFDHKGHWRSDLTAPRQWPNDPSRLLEQKEFWQALNQALADLPSRMARVFILREVEGHSTEDICDILGMTSANVWVTLHRARRQLRHRLESHLVQSGRESFKSLMAEAPRRSDDETEWGSSPLHAQSLEAS